MFLLILKFWAIKLEYVILPSGWTLPLNDFWKVSERKNHPWTVMLVNIGQAAHVFIIVLNSAAIWFPFCADANSDWLVSDVPSIWLIKVLVQQSHRSSKLPGSKWQPQTGLCVLQPLGHSDSSTWCGPYECCYLGVFLFVWAWINKYMH